ncbi:uncharacterized protein FOBCDRAFT_203571 [Fusarium oxysporum Fo47]|uniref:uncharacterized protein n=1 Tax=Fusarium oxysporum Fo47 TaxID=660027 RepID=UPI002869D946|nr:uncharacterized protein FOBCDRAFT_203571 [Fusarium oxysporum Fo47]WJG35586.1 hypothetical protein FOBCDRAFT_203571 [Fusarium oxysporum Fo47]
MPYKPVAIGGKAAEIKGDVLSSTPQKLFSNHYQGPNHPASNGGVFGLLLGGKLTPDHEKQKQRESFANVQPRLSVQSELLEHGQRRINRNTLYVMIVNMPSEEELEAARRQRSQQGSGQIGSTVAIEMVNVE